MSVRSRSSHWSSSGATVSHHAETPSSLLYTFESYYPILWKSGVVIVAVGAAHATYTLVYSSADDETLEVQPSGIHKHIRLFSLKTGLCMNYISNVIKHPFRFINPIIRNEDSYVYKMKNLLWSSVVFIAKSTGYCLVSTGQYLSSIDNSKSNMKMSNVESSILSNVAGLPLLPLVGSPGSLSPNSDSSTDGIEESSVGMTVQEFRVAGHQLIDWIARYREISHFFPVKSTVEPGYLRSKELVPLNAPEEGESWEAIMKDMETVVLPGITHWESPQFMAYFKPHCSFPCILAEIAGAGLAVNAFNWVSSPVATELEMSVTDWLGRLFGLSDDFIGDSGGRGGGVIQGSAGEAVIVAVLAAWSRILKLYVDSMSSECTDHFDEFKIREEALSRLVLYTSEQAHSIVHKACMIIGIPESRFRVIATSKSEEFGLSGKKLESYIKQDYDHGLIPFCCVGTFGSTSSTAFDCLDAIADACNIAGDRPWLPLWFHVDAAYAGAYLCCEEYRSLAVGMERSDSICVNAHKKLLCNFDCSVLWVRDRTFIVEALSLTPAYLRTSEGDSGAVIDYKDWQLPLGRRFRALKLWYVMRSFGGKGIRKHIRRSVWLAQQMESAIVAAGERQRASGNRAILEIFVPRRVALVVFRLCYNGSFDESASSSDALSDRLTRALYERVNQSGRLWLTHTVLGGSYVLRVAVGGVEVCASHIRDAALVITSIAEDIDAEFRNTGNVKIAP